MRGPRPCRRRMRTDPPASGLQSRPASPRLSLPGSLVDVQPPRVVSPVPLRTHRPPMPMKRSALKATSSRGVELTILRPRRVRASRKSSNHLVGYLWIVRVDNSAHHKGVRVVIEREVPHRHALGIRPGTWSSKVRWSGGWSSGSSKRSVNIVHVAGVTKAEHADVDLIKPIRCLKQYQQDISIRSARCLIEQVFYLSQRDLSRHRSCNGEIVPQIVLQVGQSILLGARRHGSAACKLVRRRQILRLFARA